MIISLINEYGITWLANRLLYCAKLEVMKKLPFTEEIFEKDIVVKRIDIFDIDVNRIEKFLINLSDEKKKAIISTADKAIEGKIKAFSSIELD